MWRSLFRRSELIRRLAKVPGVRTWTSLLRFSASSITKTGTIRRAVVAADHFACWLSDQHLSLSEASPTLVYWLGALYESGIRLLRIFIDKPWGGASDHPSACDCGAGAPCPECNPCDRDHPPKMPEGYRTILDKDGWRH
jgi:hypothetical protein